MIAKRLILPILITFLFSASFIAKAADRDWKTGKVLTIDRSEKPYTSEPLKRETTDSTDANGNTTRTTTVSGGPSERLVSTFWYTVSDGTKYYITRINPNFVGFTTAAKVDVGEPVKYVVDGNNLILLGTDGKEYKTEVVRVTATAPCGPPGAPQ